MIFSNGAYYEGGWKNDLRNGEGKYGFPKDSNGKRALYKGSFLDGKHHGKGFYYY